MTMPADTGSTTGTRQFDNKVKRAIPSVVHMIAGAEDAQQSEEAYNAGDFKVCAGVTMLLRFLLDSVCQVVYAKCFLTLCQSTSHLCFFDVFSLPYRLIASLSRSIKCFYLFLFHSRTLVKTASKSYWQGWRSLYFSTLTGLVPESALVR
jgi:hypothetical protein